MNSNSTFWPYIILLQQEGSARLFPICSKPKKVSTHLYFFVQALWFKNTYICPCNTILEIKHLLSSAKMSTDLGSLIGNIGFLTNRAGRNKIPYHAENNSFPSGEAARERIIFQVVRNFISSQAIGQESYIICVLSGKFFSLPKKSLTYAFKFLMHLYQTKTKFQTYHQKVSLIFLEIRNDILRKTLEELSLALFENILIQVETVDHLQNPNRICSTSEFIVQLRCILFRPEETC